MSCRSLWVLAVVALSLIPVSASAAGTPSDLTQPSLALRAGWAYGLGAEFEYRPSHWGVGVSAGYVPQYGVGGYAGLQWGQHLLDASGFVGEGGVYYGQQNPLRAADSGLGAYLMGGYCLAPTRATSVRLVAGAGMPFSSQPSFPTFEFVAKLTVGLVF